MFIYLILEHSPLTSIVETNDKTTTKKRKRPIIAKNTIYSSTNLTPFLICKLLVLFSEESKNL